MSAGNAVAARMLQLIIQAANEPESADRAKLFAKNVGGVSQLFAVTSDGVITQVSPVGSVCEMCFYACDDFISTTVSNSTAVATGTVLYVITGATCPGAARISASAVADAICLLPATSVITSITFGGNLGRFLWECRVDTETVQDGTNQFSHRYGCGDSTGADAVDGVYFESDRAVNGDNNVRLCAANGSTRTKTSMGVAPTAATLQRWKFVVNAAGSSVQGYLNDASTGSAVTTNIPTNAATAVWWVQQIKTLGVSIRRITVDYVEAVITYDFGSRASSGSAPNRGAQVSAHIASFVEASTAPTSETDEVQGYALDVSGVTQAYTKESDATPTQLTPVSGLCAMSYYACDDFVSSTVSSYNVGGAGASNTFTTAVQGAPGIVRQTASVGTTPERAVLLPATSAFTSILLGNNLGQFIFEGRCRTVNAQDGTEQWSDRWGLGDVTGNTDTADGVYFESDRAVNGDNNVRLCTSIANTRTKTSMGVAPTAGTFERWKWICNSAGTSVQGYLNDTATGAAVTTNIPTATANQTGAWWCQIVKTLGSTARSVDRDYVESYQPFPR